MQPNQTQQINDFFEWVSERYGEKTTASCREVIAAMPPDTDFNPLELAWDQFSLNNPDRNRIIKEALTEEFACRLPLKRQ